MFKVVKPTKLLVEFLLIFKLQLSKPQFQHLTNFMEALLACEGTKTIARLNRLILDATDQSAFTDFFTYSPWDDAEFRQSTRRALVEWVLAENQSTFAPQPFLIKIDDSYNSKPKESLHFEVTDWHFDTSKGRGYGYGVVFVTVHISCGRRSAPIALEIYLRAKTVRRLNRKREKGSRIPFRTKLTILKKIFRELAPLIPENTKVYVLCDSWYTSAKLIKFCRRLKWHVIGAIKCNRIFTKTGDKESQQIARHARYKRNRDFKPVTLKSSDGSVTYWVLTLKGRLKSVKDAVSIFISKKHYGDRYPEYFLCTDTSLSAQEALALYTGRWVVEVDHLYLKIRLGLGDFRLRSYKGVTRYFDLVCLTLAYLYWRKFKEPASEVKNLSDVIAKHRLEQQDAFLRAFGQSVLETGSVDQAIDYWYKQAA
ncbi:MAG: transposase [bacterium]